MRITAFFLFLGIFFAQAGTSYSQSSKVTLNVRSTTVKEACKQIEKQSNYIFVFSDNTENALNKKVSIAANSQNIEEILDDIFSTTGLSYRILDRQVIVYRDNKKKAEIIVEPSPTPQQEQTKTVTGRVTDPSGEPLPGATVMVKGSTIGTVTDVDGNFSFRIPANAQTLQISFVGMKVQEIPIANRTIFNVVLEEEAKGLEEVVAIGYGVQRKVNLTGSVSTVNVSELDNIPASNLSTALAGKLTGVRILEQSGLPGTSSSLTIRSEGTWNNASPLYVIDGIVSNKDQFDMLDASMVENLSVLKDAASAAIYGSRAANGVVLVTTKRGKQGKPKITYTGSYGIDSPTKISESATSFEQASFMNAVYKYNLKYSDTNPNYITDDELEYWKTHSTSLIKEAWMNPVTTRHAINVSGGTNNVRYFVGGTYIYSKGSFENLNYQKINLQSNVDVDISKNLTVSLDISSKKTIGNRPYFAGDIQDEGMDGLYRNIILRGTFYAPYQHGLPDGTFLKWQPLEEIKKEHGAVKNVNSIYNTIASLEYKIPFVKGLKVKATYSHYVRDNKLDQFVYPYTLYVFKTTGGHNHLVTDTVVGSYVRSSGNFVQKTSNANNNYQLNAYVTYSNSFGKHSIDGLLVYEQTEGYNDNYIANRQLLMSGTLPYFFAASPDPVNSTVDGSANESGRLSYVGRISYNYDQKYLLETSFRYDGSMNFAPENRWGFFPSVSAGWRISNENFFKVDFVDYLKLRGSVGLLGNDAVGSWQWVQNYVIGTGAVLGGLTNAVSLGTMPNRNITWEKSLNYNAGFDSQFLNNKLTFSVDGFFKHTYDILGSRARSIPSTFGATMPDENYGIINSKGIEFEIGYNNALANGIKYYGKANWAFATNKVIEKAEPENLRAYKTEIGYNTDRLFGYVVEGIFKTQEELDALPAGYRIFGNIPRLGMLKYKDMRGATSDEPDGTIDSNDQDYIAKHTIPPINYGFSVGGEWKGLSIDLYFQGATGFTVVPPYRSIRIQPNFEMTNFAVIRNYWTPDNPNGTFPLPLKDNDGTITNVSTFWAYNGSFLRLKNLTVGYNLPERILRKVGVSSAKIFFTGTNLFLLEDHIKLFDPELEDWSKYPIMKNFSLGLNLTI